MSRKWMTILLLVSLAFNLAVVGMFLFIIVFEHPPFEPPFLHHHDRDGRMGQQSQEDMMHHGKPPLLDFQREQLRPCRDSFFQDRQSFLKIMATEPFNQKAAEEALAKSVNSQDTMEMQTGKSLIQMRLKMTPKEAQDFFGQLSDMQHQRPRHRFERNEK